MKSPTLLTLLFITLKLIGTIAWSWFLVLLPLLLIVSLHIAFHVWWELKTPEQKLKFAVWWNQ